MTARKIVVFLGSNREGRFGEKVASYVTKVLQNAGLSARLFGKLSQFIELFHVV